MLKKINIWVSLVIGIFLILTMDQQGYSPSLPNRVSMKQVISADVSKETNVCRKPEPPIDIKWRLPTSRRTRVGSDSRTRTDGYQGVSTVAINIQRQNIGLFALDGNTPVEVQVTSEGGINIEQQALLGLRARTVASLTRTPAVNTIPFTISDGERGVLIAEAQAPNANGDTPHLKRVKLYFIASKRKLYTGTNSFIDLEIQKLKDEKAARLITQEQYREKLDQLLSGKSDNANQ